MIKISHSKLDVSVVTLQRVYFWKTFRIIHDISHVKMSGQQYIIRKEGNIWRDTCHGKNWFDFKLHEYLSNHQLGETPVVDQIKFLCLKRFLLEIMHCLYLCGTKLKLIFQTEGPWLCKLSQNQRDIVSNLLITFSSLLPREFDRQPRSISIQRDGKKLNILSSYCIQNQLSWRKFYQCWHTDFFCFSHALWAFSVGRETSTFLSELKRLELCY